MINNLKWVVVGLGVGLFAGALSAFFVARDHYKNDAQITALTAKNAVLATDLTIAKVAEARAQQAAETISRINQENEDVLNGLMDELKSRPAEARCVLSASDADRLHNIK